MKVSLEDRNILTRFYPVIFIEHLNIVFFKLFITISKFTLFFFIWASLNNTFGDVSSLVLFLC